MTMRKVNAEELTKLVDYTIDKGLSLYCEGFAGTGKSTIVNQEAKKKGREIVDIRLSLVDVGDLVMKMPNQGRTAMVELVNQDFVHEKPTVYLFDEFLHGSRSVQKMSYQVFLDRKLGNYRLPEGSSIFALSNPTDEVESDGMDRPMMDRMDMKVYLEFDLKRWEKWGYENDMRSEVISFVDMFNDKVINTNVENIPLTPRTWDRVSRHLDDGHYQAMLPHETGLMFKSFMDRIVAFKNIDDYLDGKTKLEDNLEHQFAFISAITNKVGKDKNDKVVSKWFDGKIKGMREEVKVFGNISILNRHKQTLAGGSMPKYWQSVDKGLQGKLMATWKDLGYLIDDKV
jgi:hypothetical protein